MIHHRINYRLISAGRPEGMKYQQIAATDLASWLSAQAEHKGWMVEPFARASQGAPKFLLVREGNSPIFVYVLSENGKINARQREMINAIDPSNVVLILRPSMWRTALLFLETPDRWWRHEFCR